MAEITAAMVKELREATGLGMMECKKALVESGGDMKAAADLMRIKSGAKASKIAGRIAAEGAVAAHIAADGKRGALVEVNCETDFVAKDESFSAFVTALAQAAVAQGSEDVAALSSAQLVSGETVEAARQALIAKLGENIGVRRVALIDAQGRLASYLHGRRIGVLIDVSGGDVQLGKDLAMHVAASKPLTVSQEDVAADVIAKEREIYAAQAAESGKPANIVEKMVEGRIVKFLAEVTLLGQPFVKDPDQTVGQLLKSKNAAVHAFRLFVVGEGIEKRKDDFAAEVMAQAGQAAR
ncbi:MAG TPA: translation elongation factor Ts [Burkholderiales bacterium]|jgi:elongation factor Ts|nr:translation elongation factor Ts [Burkholderiales bacterium]